MTSITSGYNPVDSLAYLASVGYYWSTGGFSYNHIPAAVLHGHSLVNHVVKKYKEASPALQSPQDNHHVKKDLSNNHHVVKKQLGTGGPRRFTGVQPMVGQKRIRTHAHGGRPAKKPRTHIPNPSGNNQYTRRRTTMSNPAGNADSSSGNPPEGNDGQQAAASMDIDRELRRERRDIASASGRMDLEGGIPLTSSMKATVQIERFSRNFKHYLCADSIHTGWRKTAAPAAYRSSDARTQNGGKQYFINDDWFYLPYNWIQSSMTAREYQAICCKYKRFSIKAVEVDIHNILAFEDEITSTSGTATPSVGSSPLEYFEAFLDQSHELPRFSVTASDLPNERMTKGYTTRERSRLNKIELQYYGDHEQEEIDNMFELEQSPSYKVIDAMVGFTFQHQMSPVDSQNIHPLWPINQEQMKLDHYANTGAARTDNYINPIGGVTNVQGGDFMKANTSSDPSKSNYWHYPTANALFDSLTFHAPHNPPPAILLRVPMVERKSGTQHPYGFVLHATYSIVIEGEPNFICPRPLVMKTPSEKSVFTTKELAQPTGGDSHRQMTAVSHSNTPFQN